jgi:hypothetical protein
MESFVECELWPGYRFGDQGTIMRNGKIRKPDINYRGYYRINLSVNGIVKKESLHRLIAIAFNLPNPENKPTIDHINRDPSDNRLINLRWATYQEQQSNLGMYRTNKSGVKGLFQLKTGWAASRTFMGQRTQKWFKTRPEAEAYLEEIT